VIAAPTDGFTDLVLHVLAHVRVGEAGCVHDPRYVAWVRGRAPAELERMLGEDAAVLERAWSGGRMPEIVHAWPELLGSIEALRASATLELRALAPEQVRDAGVLARLVACNRPELELLHATMCMLAPWFADWRAAEVEPALRAASEAVQPWLEPAARVLPSLGDARIELAWALGPRGRGFPTRIVVGAVAPWFEGEAIDAVVLALHEQSVIDSGHASWMLAEWEGLTRLAARMVAAPEALRRAHARWLGSLELRSLLEPLHAAGRVTTEQRDALQRVRDERALRLAALAE
jgi:hypothetical protein